MNTAELSNLLSDIAQSMDTVEHRGKVADYIPQLAQVNTKHFGIAVATPDGQIYRAGDAHTPFSIQSISKVFALTLSD